MPAMDVVCYLHTRQIAPLLSTALGVGHAVRSRGLHVHLERHWLHGPHLRVRLHTDDPSDGTGAGTAAVLDEARLVHASLTEHLVAHPCPPDADADPAELLARSVISGRAELVPGPYEPIHPHATVRIETVDESSLAALLGGRGAVATRATLMEAGMHPLAAAVDHILNGAALGAKVAVDRRVQIALSALTAHATHYPSGIADGHHTFLSHVQDFLHDHDPHGRVEARFAAEWTRHGDRVTAYVRRVVETGPRDQLDVRWADWATFAWRTCVPAHSRGDLPLEQGPEYQRRAAGLGTAAAERWDPARHTLSEYHQRLRLVDYITGNEANVAAYRFATNILYRLLLTCGVSPLERLLAAHLLTEAAQRITGRRWHTSLPPLRRTRA